MSFVPKITKPDLTLMNVAVDITLASGAVVLVDLKKLKLQRKIQKKPRDPGSRKTERIVFGKESLMIEFEGINGPSLSACDIQPKTPITAITIHDNATVPEDVLWADTFTLWPLPWYFGDVATEIAEDPSTWTGEVCPNVDGLD